MIRKSMRLSAFVYDIFSMGKLSKLIDVRKASKAKSRCDISGVTRVFEIDDNRVVEIELCGTVHEVYDEAKVSIINKYSGLIVNKRFPFKEIFPSWDVDSPIQIRRWACNDPWEWVGNITEDDIDMLQNEIYSYISIYK